MARHHDVLRDQPLEIIVEGTADPIGITRRFDKFRRYWIAGHPQLDRPIVDAVSAAQDLGGRVTRVAPGTDVFEVERAACFEIVYEHMLCHGTQSLGSRPDTARPHAAG